MSKTGYYITSGIGGIIGGFLGSLLDGGNFLGFWGIFGTLVGGIAGIYVGYKIGQNM